MPHTIDIDIGRKIQALLRLKGISQAKLGAAIGVQFKQVQKYETGLTRINCSRPRLIAQALEEPVANFFQDTDGTAEKQVNLENTSVLPGVVAWSMKGSERTLTHE
jgi:transcriptional regulator with XRE-family HTH domain